MLEFKNDIAKLGGWLTKAEGIFLYETAKMINPQDAIVEIGSWKGRSTICLTKGAQDGTHAKTYAIDPHVGSSEHQKMFDQVDTYQEFIENIKSASVDQSVVPIRKTSEEASKNFHKPIGFLFIDGAHEFKFVRLDIKLWLPKVKDDGIIAFHDTWGFPGPNLATAIELITSPYIKNPKLVDTITYFDKVKKNSFYDHAKNILFLINRILFGWLGVIKFVQKGNMLK